MRRNEIFLALGLGLLLIAGIGYQTYRGAGKGTEIIIAHPGTTPFEQGEESDATPVAQQIKATTTTPSIVSHETNRLLQFMSQAGLNQLQQIPGIGEVTAGKIVQHRKKKGPFQSMDDILAINGIGSAKLNNMVEFFKNQVSSPNPIQTPLFQPTTHYIPPKTYSNRQTSTLRKIPLNHATQEQLMNVPGLGEALSSAILKARSELRGFQTWKQVEKISGIGVQRLNTIREYFTLPEDQNNR